MAVITMKQLLEAGVHFGHQTRRWNPKMDKYIYTSRSGIHIIDLQKTVVLVEEAYQKLLEICKNGGKILFVGTKKQAQDVVKEESIRTGSFYVSQRWLGGTLTNFKTIRKSIRRLHDITRMDKDGTFDRLPKKEVIGLKKELAKLEKFLGGIKDMKTLPEAVFVIDPMKEKNAVLEARKLKIPVFGIVDTNCDPDLVDVIIPANDDAIRSVRLIVGKLANAAIEAVGGEIIETPMPPRQEQNDRSQYNKRPYDKNKRPFNKDTRTNKPFNKDRKPFVKREDNRPASARPTTARPTTARPAAVKPAVKAPVKTEVKAPVKAVAKAPVKTEVKVAPVAKAKPVEAKVTAKAKDFNSMTVAELKVLAKNKGLTGISKLKKADLIEALK